TQSPVVILAFWIPAQADESTPSFGRLCAGMSGSVPAVLFLRSSPRKRGPRAIPVESVRADQALLRPGVTSAADCGSLFQQESGRASNAYVPGLRMRPAAEAQRAANSAAGR